MTCILFDTFKQPLQIFGWEMTCIQFDTLILIIALKLLQTCLRNFHNFFGSSIKVTMGKPQARKKQHKGDKPLKEKYRTRRKTKDLDQIHHDMIADNAVKLIKQPVDYDVTGNAQHYCLHCARYFINETALKDHFRTKVHKRRLKKLETDPYTQEEAERAAGMGSYVAPKTSKVTTQSMPEKMDDEDEPTSNDT